MTEILRVIDENKLDSFEKIDKFFRLAPYFLHVIDDKINNFYLLKYDQIKTDFSLPAAREARGIILEKETNRIVCFPFTKFFNVGEKYAANIDWKTAIVQHKYDGSIIKVYWNHVKHEWSVATNGTTDAHNANVGPINNGRSFYDLFQDAARLSNLDLTRLDKQCTYMFELLHPESTIVIRYKTPKLVHIGTRNNQSFLETYDFIGVEQVETFALATCDECREAATQLGPSQEGFVVRDANFNRVKIKGPVYVQLHHRLTDFHLTDEEAAAQMVLKGQQDEIKAYSTDERIQEIIQNFDIIDNLLDKKAQHLAKLWTKICDEKPQTQKDIVVIAKKHASDVFPYMMARAKSQRENLQDSQPTHCYFKTLILDKHHSESLNRSDIRAFLAFLKQN